MVAVSSNSSNMQLYSMGASKVSSVLNQTLGSDSEISQMAGKLPSILNGSYDAIGGVVDALPISNPTVKLVVGSAVDILKAWLGAGGNGADRADATKAKNDAQAASNNMQTETNNTESKVDQVMSEVTNQANSSKSQVEAEKQQIDELEQQNNDAQEQIDALTKRNQEIDKEIADLFSKYECELPEPKDGKEGGEIDYNNMNLEAFPSDVQEQIQKLIDERGSNLVAIGGHRQTIETNSSTIEAGYQQIDDLASGIMDTIEQGKSAVTELTNVLSGKQKMFSQEQLVNAATQLTKSAINGTEGGVLAAFATASGLSSIFTLGATATQTAQAAEASADKFASVPARVASQVAIKMAESVAKQAVNSALSQLTSITGVNFNQLYTEAMQAYNMASAGNQNASISFASNSNTPKASGTPQPVQTNKGGGEAPKPDKPAVA